MQEFWNWLHDNSIQLQTFGGLTQALGSAAAFAVAIVLACVAKRQARAADAQAEAAETQAKAAEVQISTSLFIADRQASPNISITAAVSRDGILIKDKIAILNNGFGTASEVKLIYRDSKANSDVPLSSSTLVVRDSMSASIDGSRAGSPGLTLSYSTAFGTKYALEFDWESTSFRSVNEKLIIVESRFAAPNLSERIADAK
jgi:hypothetical protein